MAIKLEFNQFVEHIRELTQINSSTQALIDIAEYFDMNGKGISINFINIFKQYDLKELTCQQAYERNIHANKMLSILSNIHNPNCIKKLKSVL